MGPQCSQFHILMASMKNLYGLIYACLEAQPLNSQCKLNELSSEGLFKNANYSFSQEAWESHALSACEATDSRAKTGSTNPVMELYQTRLIKPDMNLFYSEQEFGWSGIQFICCPRYDEIIQKSIEDPLAKSVKLIQAFDFDAPLITRPLLEINTNALPVVGSFILKCDLFLAYTRPEKHARGPSFGQHWIHLGSKSMKKVVNFCPLKEPIDKSTDLVNTCKSIYHGHEIMQAMLAPTMVDYTDPDTKMTHKLRAVWCLGKTSFTMVLPSLPECDKVSELNSQQGADTTCASQFELERKAKSICQLDTKKKLYSAYPRIPCNEDGNTFESLHFVCCPFESAEELEDQTNNEVMVEELKKAFEGIKQGDDREAREDYMKLDQKLVLQAAELETIARSDKEVNALDSLMDTWLDHESLWSSLEAEEHAEIESRLQDVEKIRENQLTKLLVEAKPSVSTEI
ncbi:hypothetical protein Ciccas_007113 [Cichlidogyrus casuarinus]|uniref:Uncharacterized protein n=1 Tax=Cichlidogyrus casuarinus TaxID=1844966 RepID=A0ABD2Q4X6_9PLAT